MARDSPTYVQQLQDQLDEVHVFARENIKISSHATKKYYDVKTLDTNYEEGTSVWLHNPQRKKGRSPKLSRNWDGPYVVMNRINDIVVRIRKSLRANPKVVHVNRLKPYNGDNSVKPTASDSLR